MCKVKPSKQVSQNVQIGYNWDKSFVNDKMNRTFDNRICDNLYLLIQNVGRWTQANKETEALIFT